MAWDDEPWILDGAAARIAIVGFDNGQEQNRVLDGMPVATIKPDLTSDIDVTIAPSLVENQSLAFEGDKRVDRSNSTKLKLPQSWRYQRIPTVNPT